MAKLPALIETLEAFHPQDAAAIRYAARALRDADRLSGGAGGRGAPEMTSRDAVNLVLALNLAEAPNRYVEAADAGFDLPAQLDRGDTACRTGGTTTEPPAVVAAVAEATSLGAAMVTLVDGAEALCPPRPRVSPFAETASDQRRNVGPAVVVTILKQQGELLARVRMDWRDDGGFKRQSATYGEVKPGQGYGRWTTVHFDQALFLALRRTLAAPRPWVFAAEPDPR